jgi:tRNA1(Val) A37 N6-methylase TrmN6
MRPHGKTKLGFFPLPVAEAAWLKNCLVFPSEFPALDPCVGDGVAFAHLLHEVSARRYGIEIDANRAEQARALGIETLQANAMDVRCQGEAVSLLYLNPPYDWESGESNNPRLESVFLEHCYRWLKAGGVLVFVLPQLRLAKCARLLSEHFTDLRVFRLTEPACLEYKQIVVLATRRKRHSKVSDAALLDGVRHLEALATKSELEPLGETADVRYEVPASEPAVLTQCGYSLG